jgi:hypothetical protein
MAQVLDEIAVGGMDVEIPRSAWPRVRESVDDVRWDGDRRAGVRQQRLGPICELELSLEDVERVDVLLVEVGAGALEVGPDADLVDRDLGPLELHDDSLVQPLALAGA